MPNNQVEQFKEAKAHAARMLSGATADEAFELGFWKGRLAGMESVMIPLKENVNGKLANESTAVISSVDERAARCL